MEFLSTFLPIVLYFLASVLLILLIILSLKLIIVINKVENLTDDATKKLKSLNSIFRVIDNFTDRIALINDRIVMTITSLLSRVFNRKRKDDNNE